VGDYPKFYKMDLLSKLGFLASELLLQAEGNERFVKRSDRAVLLFNRTGSLHADNAYLQTIRDPNQFYPSPSLFIYTLPNMSAGEIAIRNKYQGETAFYVLQERNQPLIEQIVKVSLLEASTRSVLYGWLDVEDDSHFEAELMLGFLN
jgi:3-oxoacyl-[acyl-carrier-protein] synthase-1